MAPRITTMIRVMAAMNAAPSATAARPARRVPSTSRRPTAWPTRTVAAIETPNGTMKMIDAVVTAI
jgi:hypothetical protein